MTYVILNDGVENVDEFTAASRLSKERYRDLYV